MCCDVDVLLYLKCVMLLLIGDVVVVVYVMVVWGVVVVVCCELLFIDCDTYFVFMTYSQCCPEHTSQLKQTKKNTTSNTQTQQHMCVFNTTSWCCIVCMSMWSLCDAQSMTQCSSLYIESCL